MKNWKLISPAGSLDIGDRFALEPGCERRFKVTGQIQSIRDGALLAVEFIDTITKTGITEVIGCDVPVFNEIPKDRLA